MAFSRQLFIIANFSILNVFRSPGYVDENIEDIDENSSYKKSSLFQAKRLL